MTGAGVPDAAQAPGDVGPVLYRSAMLVAAKRPGHAERLLRGALAANPQDPRLLAALSEVVLGLGRAADAEVLARAAVTAGPSAVTWANLAQVLLAGHDPAGASAAARCAIEAAPRHPEPYCLAALSLAAATGYGARQHAEARALVRQALEAAPPSAFVCLVAGDVDRVHDPVAARGWYEKALELEPMNTVAMLRLADAAGGTPTATVLLARSVLALDPLDVAAQNRLADAVSTGLRRFGLLGQLAALLATIGAGWLPAQGVAAVVLLAGAAMSLGAWSALHEVTRTLPPEFVRAVRRGTTRARITTACYVAAPLLSGAGLGSLVVRGGDPFPGDLLLTLAVLALAPASVLQLQALHDRALVEGFPEDLHRQVVATLWRPAVRATVAWGVLAAAAVVLGAVGWMPHPTAGAVLAVQVAAMTLPPAAARVVDELGVTAGGRRRPSVAALLILGVGTAELAAGVALLVLPG